MNTQERIQEALRFYNAGDYRRAKEICARILDGEPKNAEVLYFMGVLSSHLGDHKGVISNITKSLALHPENPDGCHLVAMSYEALGNLEKAEEYYRKTIRQNPKYAEAYNNLANVLKERGRRVEAIEQYERAIALKPYSATFHFNLGVALQEQRDLERAIEAYRTALMYDPKNEKILLMLGSALHQNGQIHGTREAFRDAETLYREMVRANPRDHVAYLNLGKILQDQDKYDDAIASYRNALAIKPDYDEALFSLGDVYHKMGNREEAISHYRRATEVNPQFFEAYNNLGLMFAEINQIDEAMECFQACLRIDDRSPRAAWGYNNLGNMLSDIGRPAEAEEQYRRGLALAPALSKLHSNLLFSMNYSPRYAASELLSEHLKYAEKFEGGLYQTAPPFSNPKVPTRRLRIGYLSPDFRVHSVAFFIEPVIEAHDRSSYEIVCYADHRGSDEMTERIRRHADLWREVSGLSDERIADLIRSDGIDILVDLAGHTSNNRLPVFARKPAPVQVSWIGYPSTTGLKAIDYKIVDAYTDPPGMTEAYYTERLVRLPETFLCYRPVADAPPVQPPPAERNGWVTFGSFNNIAKVSEDIVGIWAGVLRAVPDSRLFLKANGLISNRAREYIHGLFRRNGIPEERVSLFPPIPSISQHLSFYNTIDIALDTFPYHGTTTTCEAFWMGVPVVTLAGKTHATRVGVSLLTNVGVTDLIAGDPAQYVEIARELSADRKRLGELRSALRNRMARSPLTDARRFTRHVEAAFRTMWTRWCEGEDPESFSVPASDGREPVAVDTTETRITVASSASRRSIIDAPAFSLPLPIEGIRLYRKNDDRTPTASFVVCAMFTPGADYDRFADRLVESCERFRLPYAIYEVPDVHTSISLRGTEDPSKTKPNFIAHVMREFQGRGILYVDVDVLFVDDPRRIQEIAESGYDFAIYNWLADRHNEAYMPLSQGRSGGGFDMRHYTYSHHIAYYCTDQLICSGGTQYYRESEAVRSLLEKWQETISMCPIAADDECLDYAFNHLDPTDVSLRTVWLDKSLLRMPWWPHAKPVILHPGVPRAGNRTPLSELIGRQRFYPEWCEQKKESLVFPPGYIVDTAEKRLIRVEGSRIVESRQIEGDFWVYPEEIGSNDEQ